MIKRIISLLVGFILGAVLCAFLMAPRHEEPPKVNKYIDLSTAIDATIHKSNGDKVSCEYYTMTHECCDCALTHNVIMFVVPGEGLRMLWWRDELRTRRQREGFKRMRTEALETNKR